jgi:TetR/AcrR family transcriptional regulator, repressor for uid operon
MWVMAASRPATAVARHSLHIDAAAARREHILAAAERCFIRNGFHRTTMLDLAKAAKMSAGNFYRYFESKEAIVLGLAQRERTRGEQFVVPLKEMGDLRAAMLHVIREYHVTITPGKAVLWLDIWAESTRNPDLAASYRAQRATSRAFFVRILSVLASAPSVDVEALYAAIDPLMKGYDPEPAYEQLLAIIDRCLSGQETSPETLVRKL